MQPDEYNLGYLLNKATLRMKWELNNKLLAFDITVPQWSVLRDLYTQEMLPEPERRITPADVALRLLADRPTISGVIERLAKKGYIRSEPNPTDRRSQFLRLTTVANELMPQLENGSQATLDQAFKGMTKEQINQLKNSLLTVIRNLEH